MYVRLQDGDLLLSKAAGLDKRASPGRLTRSGEACGLGPPRTWSKSAARRLEKSGAINHPPTLHARYARSSIQRSRADMTSSTTSYQPVPPFPDFPAMERRLLEFWREIDAFGQLRRKNAGKPSWKFLDGPITANNPMGVHHAWGRSYKDMFQRYHAMNGKELRYQNGFDCQGLWVEVEVEKALGFETKADIVSHGLDTFVRTCKERVLTYAARQTEQSIRLGYWTDWDDPQTLLALRDALREGKDEITITTPSGNEATGSPEELIARLGNKDWGGSYFTFSNENNYTIWGFLKTCHEQGFIYRGTDVMPWCCRCGTGLSQMEVNEGRKIVRHTSVFVRFPLKDREKEALLVWTTTPWTLTSNVAAAVNPDMTYLQVRHGEWTLYLGKGNFENRPRSRPRGRRQEREGQTPHPEIDPQRIRQD